MAPFKKSRSAKDDSNWVEFSLCLSEVSTTCGSGWVRSYSVLCAVAGGPHSSGGISRTWMLMSWVLAVRYRARYWIARYRGVVLTSSHCV